MLRLADTEEKDTKQSCEWALYHYKVCGWLSRDGKSTLRIPSSSGNSHILALSGNNVDIKMIKTLSINTVKNNFSKESNNTNINADI